jgi:hypothetical protein
MFLFDLRLLITPLVSSNISSLRNTKHSLALRFYLFTMCLSNVMFKIYTLVSNYLICITVLCSVSSLPAPVFSMYTLLNLPLCIMLSACPFTLCRGFFTHKIGPIPPKVYGLSICRGTKLRKKTAIVPHSAALYPQFQNSVGTLCYMLSAVIP